MRVSLRAALCLIGLVAGFTIVTNAQTGEQIYIVTYVEVIPTSTTAVIDLLQQQADTSRDSEGNSLFQVVQRIGRPNHFGIIETWDDADAQATHVTAIHTQTFREALDPLLYSPYDERIHINLHVEDGSVSAGTIFGLTHVDFPPNNLDVGLAHIAELVMSSREHTGVVRFDIVTQEDRRNHMTLIESWESAGAQEAHTVSEDAIAFRNATGSILGALYDERLYRAL